MINTENQKLKDFFTSKGLINVFGYSNKYCDVFITDKPKKNILEIGILKGIGEEVVEIPGKNNKKAEKKVFTKYIRPAKGIINFDDFHDEELMNRLDLDGKTGFSLGVDIETGKKPVEFFKGYTNIHIAGAQGSGKSITLLTLFYQLYHKKYSEFIIFDKGDLQFLKILPKVVTGANILQGQTENLFQLYNYLFLQGRKRNVMFAKAGVKKYYDYMEKYFQGDENAKEPLNHIFVVMDEYNTWRSQIDDSLGNGEFDNKIKDIINVLRFAGVSLIPATQTLYASDIGQLSRGGMGNVYGGVVSKADIIDNQDVINNLSKYLQGTFLFYGVKTNKFYKAPYLSSDEVILDKLENLKLEDNYTNLKTDTLSNLVNKYLIQEKDSSLIMKNYEENFKFFGLTTNQIRELEQDFLFSAFSVLVYKIKDMFDKGVLDGSYDIRQPVKFKTKEDEVSLDETIQKNLIILFSKEEKKFIKEIESCFEIAETDPDEFIDAFGEKIRVSLIRRGIIGNDNYSNSDEETKKLTKKEEIRNTTFESKDQLLNQVLEKEEDKDFVIDIDDEYDDETTDEHDGMKDIAEILRNS